MVKKKRNSKLMNTKPVLQKVLKEIFHKKEKDKPKHGNAAEINLSRK
jgi:hypothetical protein